MKTDFFKRRFFALLVFVTLAGLNSHTVASAKGGSTFKDCGSSTHWCMSRHLQEKVKAAKAAMPAWELREKAKPFWQKTSLQPLPLESSILKVFNNPQMGATPLNSHGYRELHFNLRRAAHFTKLIFDELNAITVLRCNTNHPAPAASAASPDAHLTGTAADIGYITQGSGSDPLATIDYERSFWFVYALIHGPEWKDGINPPSGRSTYLLMDYSDEMRAYARMASDSGLITTRDLNVFLNSNMRDKYRNHDDHIHVDVRGW